MTSFSSLARILLETQNHLHQIARLLKNLSEVAHEISIDDLELSVRAYNVCDSEGLRTLAAIAGKTETEMLCYRKFGKRSLNELRAVLADFNLQFAEESKVENKQ